MLRFKTARIASEWASDKPKPLLRAIIDQMTEVARVLYDADVTLTCVYRTQEEDAALYHEASHSPGVHCYWRGADVSVIMFTFSQVKELCARANDRFKYDPERPWMRCAIFEATGEPGVTAPHIHVQMTSTTVDVGPVMDAEVGQVL